MSFFSLFISYFFRASCCDVDENGVRYMVFCRVIMGNMELLQAGSEQFHPSSEDFDSGIDDLQNPMNYIVWNVNKSTHIYPEYAVSFKLSSDIKGDFSLKIFTGLMANAFSLSNVA
ncbi:Cell differentiation protein rcd1 [Sarracenia purpurea var. burkii]